MNSKTTKWLVVGVVLLLIFAVANPKSTELLIGKSTSVTEQTEVTETTTTTATTTSATTTTTSPASTTAGLSADQKIKQVLNEHRQAVIQSVKVKKSSISSFYDTTSQLYQDMVRQIEVEAGQAGIDYQVDKGFSITAITPQTDGNYAVTTNSTTDIYYSNGSVENGTTNTFVYYLKPQGDSFVIYGS